MSEYGVASLPGDVPQHVVSEKHITTGSVQSTITKDVSNSPVIRPSVVNWRPARLLSGTCGKEVNFALLILNQPLENLNLLKLVWEKAVFRIAADGGTNHLFEAFRDPSLENTIKNTGLEVVCGDLDSITPAAENWAREIGAKVIKNPDQYSTDFKKCVVYLNEHHPTPDVVCMGGLGGRVDQGMSTLHHLLLFQGDYAKGAFYLLSAEGITFVLRPGVHRIHVRDPESPRLGKHIGIIPVGESSTITTKGLEWDVENWHTSMGGENLSTSNHVKDDFVTITTTNTVLFTIDLNFPIGSHIQ